MKEKTSKWLILLVFLLATASVYAYVELGNNINTLQPIIKVDFVGNDDFSYIINYNLTDSSSNLFQINEISSDLVNKIFRYQPTSNLANNRDYYFTIAYSDDIGNINTTNYHFKISLRNLSINITEPEFGYTSIPLVNVTIHTDRNVECKYSGFLVNNFSQDIILIRFNSSDGYDHRILDKTVGNNEILYVICNDSFTGSFPQARFTFVIQTEPPVFNSVRAEPSEITDPNDVNTDLVVTTNQETLCSYSLINGSRISAGTFPEGYSTSHRTNVNMDTFASNNRVSYDYNINCQNKAKLSTNTTVNVVIDLLKAFGIASVQYPSYVTTNIALINVTTTKEGTSCLLLNSTDMSVLKTMTLSNGNKFFSTTFENNKLKEGNNLFYVSCAGGNPSTSIDSSLTIVKDTQAPVLVKFNVTDIFIGAIYLELKATDNVSGVDYFRTRLYNGSNHLIQTEDLSADSEGEFNDKIDDVHLNENLTYSIKVYAVDNVGWNSSEQTRSGLIAEEQTSCNNNVKDSGETDIDCGGDCDSCSLGGRCKINSDCTSNFCNPSGRCALSNCSDKLLGSNEADVDCGGNCSAKCEDNKKCTKDSDCKSNNCDAATKKCKTLSTCSNLKLDLTTETDVDCGKICAANEGKLCALGKICEISSDCSSGNCTNKKCTAKAVITPPNANTDTDKDGLPDWWQIKYFGSAVCKNPSICGPNADPDKDGLTNLMEYTYNTDPNNNDLDGDGCNDKAEIDKGSDPNDPSSNNCGPNVMLIILIIIILGVLGFAGYMAYKNFAGKGLGGMKGTKGKNVSNLGKLPPLGPPKMPPPLRMQHAAILRTADRNKNRMKMFDVFGGSGEQKSKEEVKEEIVAKPFAKKERSGYIELKQKEKISKDDEIFSKLEKFLKENKSKTGKKSKR